MVQEDFHEASDQMWVVWEEQICLQGEVY